MKTKFEWKLKKNQLMLTLLVGILLIVIAMPVKKTKTKDVPVEAGTENSYEDEYEEAVERKLEEVLREVEGVGNVKVMVTFQSSSEKIIEKDQATNSQTVTESDKQGGKRETKEAQDSEATVYNSTSGGEQTPYVTKEVNPKVEGVVVIAEGGGNAVVIKNITEAIQALFDVDTHKIKVMKRNQTNQEELHFETSIQEKPDYYHNTRDYDCGCRIPELFRSHFWRVRKSRGDKW